MKLLRWLPLTVALLLAPFAVATVGAAGLVALPPAPAVRADLAELGRRLFFDSRLSGDLGRSCASCHAPERAWADGRVLSLGYPGSEYFRNAPGLANVALRPRLMWDGRLDGADLATAVRDMVTEAHFMNADARLVQERIAQVAEYRLLWQRAFGAASLPSGPLIFAAVAEFLKTLRSRNAPIDRHLAGDTTALSAAARAGLALFSGKAGCLRCHSGLLYSDGALHRSSVAENPAVWREPLRLATVLRHYASSGVPNYMNQRRDLGAYAISKSADDRGRFLTPSLRELRYTAPYMHNGMLATLAEVVDHYDRGTAETPPLHLTALEKRQLLAFLDALSGDAPARERPVPGDFQPGELAMAALPLSAASPAPSFLHEVSLAEPPQPRPLAPLPPVPVPTDNPQSAEKIALGRLLFFDPRLSGDGSTPCFSCHFPSRGWGEGGARSRGYPGTWHWRNAQTVLNAAYFSRLNWDGAANSLEQQAAGAAEGAVAGNGDPAMMEMRLRLVPDYVRRFRSVFGTPWPRLNDAYRALAAFQRTVVSDPRRVPLDRYLQGEEQVLNPAARRGLALFSGKAGCLRCHDGALASDQRFHATGVPSPTREGMTPLIAVTHRWQNVQRGASAAQMAVGSADRGLYYVSFREDDVGKFRTPSLRELRHTAPYMHNGAFASLREVVDFYDGGGGQAANKPAWLRPLGLSEAEKDDLLALLDAMSMDEPPVVTAPQLPPYAIPED